MAGGEGSRGGHVIRRTKSGKAVYGSPADHRAKIKKHAVHAAKGAALASAGVGVSAAAALGATALDRRSQVLKGFGMSASKRADRHWNSERGFAGVMAGQKSEKLYERAARVGKLGSKVAKFGIIGGAALIALGINESLKETKLGKDDKTRQAVSAASGSGAAFALKNVYAAAMFNDVGPLKAVKIAAQTAAKRAIRRF